MLNSGGTWTPWMLSGSGIPISLQSPCALQDSPTDRITLSSSAANCLQQAALKVWDHLFTEAQHEYFCLTQWAAKVAHKAHTQHAAQPTDAHL